LGTRITARSWRFSLKTGPSSKLPFPALHPGSEKNNKVFKKNNNQLLRYAMYHAV